MSEVVDARLLGFVGLSALLILTPGPDTALTIRSALAGGAGAAVSTALGVAVGTTLWLTAAMFGVSFLVANSPTATLVLRIAGATYLAYLGFGSLARSRGRAPAQRVAAGRLDRRAAFRQGLLSNLLNPKAGTFFLTVMPTFIRSEDPAIRLVLMVAAYEVMVVSWLSGYGAVVAFSARAIGGERIRRGLEAATGLVLLGLAALLLLEL